MNRTLKLILLVIISSAITSVSTGQCTINAMAAYAGVPHQDTLTVDIGSSIDLMSQGTCATIFKDNFNSQFLDSNWTSSPANPAFNNPCQCPFVGGQPPNNCPAGVPGQAGPDGAFAWIGATYAQERSLATRAFDLTP